MAEAACPACESDVADAVSDAVRAGEQLAITGGGSKAGMGRDVPGRALPMSGLAGVVDYDPAELVLAVRPGTPLAEVTTMVAGERQMLAFEPFDHGPVFGHESGAATIGGVVAAGVAGSRRVSAGGARDHLLGLRAVSGRGEIFVAGAKVVKNVTGFDLPKLAAGSWGRLFAMTELTLKMLPRPETMATLFLSHLDPQEAVQAMAAAMGSQAVVACAAHRPARDGEPALTALRLEGFAPSVAARVAMLDRVLTDYGPLHHAGEVEGEGFWAGIRTLALLPPAPALWRINVPPSAGAAVAAVMDRLGAAWLMDWAGGLIWAAVDGAGEEVRAAADRAGGHATLVRSSAQEGAIVPAFHPPAPGLAALEERVRRAFDPGGVFETGRF